MLGWDFIFAITWHTYTYNNTDYDARGEGKYAKYDGGEVCEIVGLYILSILFKNRLKTKVPPTEIDKRN